MDPYRRPQDPTQLPLDMPPNRRRAVRVAIGLSALAHVALLTGAWLRAPTVPDPPRTAEVRVLVGQTLLGDATSEAGLRMDGYARARVRAR